MSVDKGKVAEAAMGFLDHLSRNYGPDAEVIMVAAVAMVKDGEGKLSAPWSSPPAGGPVTAWMLRAAADAMEADHLERGGEPWMPPRFAEGEGVVCPPGARLVPGLGVVLGE